jgi:hypothetical protein
MINFVQVRNLTQKMNKKPRIISMVWRDLAEYHANLHDGFDQLEIKNHFFFEASHAFYTCEKNRSMVERWIILLNNFIYRSKNNFFQKIIKFIFLRPLIIVLKVILFPYFLCRYDVFIFGANYSFLGLYIDRIFLKIMGKIIIDPVSGSDVRPPYLNGGYSDLSIKKIHQDTHKKSFWLHVKLMFTTHIIDHPTVSQFHNKKYIPHLYVGFPFSLPPMEDVKKRKKPLILHAPSNPKIKGSDIIREVISELKSEFEFEYEELVGVPHTTVLKKIQECHFVINELYSDTPMAGLDTEAAGLGRASIVGGYNLDMVCKTIKNKEIPPSYRITPTKEELKKAVIHLLTDPKYCQKLGEEAQKFVQKNWNSKAVAQKYLDIIHGDIPEEVMQSADDDIDVYGCGLNVRDRNHMIFDMVEKYGEKSLCLEAKPKLKDALLRECGLYK